MTESLYILYRKIKASVGRLCFYLCRIFPINNELVSVCSFEGKGGYGCNPKYLVRELHKKNANLRFVWFVDDNTKEFPKYIKKVSNNVLSRAYWLSRSKVWIDNYRKPYGTVKRKGQYYINVNHFTIGIKPTGLLRGSGFSKMAYIVNKNDSDMIDAMVIDSKWCEQCYKKAMLYRGEMLKTGAPRCDVLYGDRSRYKEKFRIRHNLPKDAKVVMFAPTFREGSQDGKRYVFSEVWTIDFTRVLRAFEKSLGGNWYICIRVHPQLAASFNGYGNSTLNDRIIDESRNDDMYEILAGMDAYITDYSSAIFEAGFAHIPGYIYADDIDTYRAARGNLYWDFSSEDRKNVKINKNLFPKLDVQLPFTVAKNNDQLEEDIFEFDKEDYITSLDEFHKRIGLVFDGKASERIAGIIMKKVWSFGDDIHGKQ